jgi:chromosomal replication initiation ATPase DnaA
MVHYYLDSKCTNGAELAALGVVMKTAYESIAIETVKEMERWTSEITVEEITRIMADRYHVDYTTLLAAVRELAA